MAFSPAPIWAGQWLFVDDDGQYRVGSCTFNRGIHPTIDAPSFPVSQLFPNDPTGAKGAYLTWRYGDTTDDLIAAAMWAVFHYYAQDGAGTRRAFNGAAPLIPSLTMIAAASGSDAIQTVAVALDAEAAAFADEWTISVRLSVDGQIYATVTTGSQPIAGATVTLLMSGQDSPATVQTDPSGHARSAMPVVPGVMTVAASTAAPGLAAVYRGSPAGPDPHGAQRLVTGGPPRIISATATVEVLIPPTTTTTTHHDDDPTHHDHHDDDPCDHHHHDPDDDPIHHDDNDNTACGSDHHLDGSSNDGGDDTSAVDHGSRHCSDRRGPAARSRRTAAPDRQGLRPHLLPGHLAARGRDRHRRCRQPALPKPQRRSRPDRLRDGHDMTTPGPTHCRPAFGNSHLHSMG